ncbi:hypothetical protein MCOR17_011575 [Pyricularia oryzae]|nr:hypothetical protein MCOR17_011575 [Pyricularia oryzae]
MFGHLFLELFPVKPTLELLQQVTYLLIRSALHIKKCIFAYEPICILAAKIVLNNSLADNDIAKYPFVFSEAGRYNAEDADDKAELDVWKAHPDAGSRPGRADVAYTPEVSKDNVVAADEACGVNIGISYGLVVGVAIGVFIPTFVEK